MIRRTKTRHRLLILLGITAALLLGVTVFVLVRTSQIKARITASRAEGMVALEQKDYESALHKLGTYLQRHPEDMEVSLAYAKARQEVPRPNGRHLTDAIAVLRRVITSEPDNLEAGRTLLKLYTRVGYITEAAELAQSLLRYAPQDAELLEIRFQALLLRQDYAGVLKETEQLATSTGTSEQAAMAGHLHRWRAEALRMQGQLPEALAEADKFTAAAPGALPGYLLTYDILREMAQPSEAYFERLAKWKEQDVDARILRLLEAHSHRMAGAPVEAVKILQDLDDEPILDAQYIRALAIEFEQLNLFHRSLDVLQKVAGKLDDPGMQVHTAERLLQAGRREALDNLIAELDLEHHLASSQLLAYQALARFDANESAKAQIEQLAARVDENAAQDWLPLLRTLARMRQGEQPPSLTERIKVFREATERRANAFAYHFLASAYREAGELDLAITAWRKAIETSPTWATPRLEMARAMMVLQQPLAAAAAAESALQRSPNNGDAYAMLITALAAASDRFNEEQINGTMNLVRHALSQPQLREDIIVPVAQLLARGNELKDLRALIESTLARDPLPHPGVLQMLANISRDAKLGLEDACHAAIAQNHGDNAFFTAMNQVNAMQAAGQFADAVPLLDQAITHAPADQHPRLQVMRLQLLDASGNAAEAIAQCRRLLADYSNNRGVLDGVLQSNALWQDRELTQQAIKQLKAVSPADSIAVQVYEARFDLAGSPDTVALRELLQRLNNLVRQAPTRLDLRLVLSQVHARLGDTQAAVQQLTQAINQSPNNLGLQLELVRLLLANDDRAQARLVLQRLHERNPDDPNLRIMLARAYAEIGDVDDAIKLARSVDRDDDPQAAARLLLATLHAQRGDTAEALRIFDALIQQPPTPAAAVAAASFYYSQNDRQRLAAAMESLERAEPNVVQRHLILGAFWTSRGNAEQALSHFKQAIAADSRSVPAWAGLLQWHITHSDLPTIVEVMTTADQARLNDPRIAFLLRQRELVGQLKQANSITRSLILGLLSASDAEREAVRTMIAAVVDIENGNTPTQTRINQLQQVAGNHPRVAPVQVAFAAILASQGQYREAADLTERLARANPQMPLPLEMTIQYRSLAGEYRAALTAANNLRTLIAGQNQSTQAVDLLMADLLVRTNRAVDALNLLQPHFEQSADPSEAFILQYATAAMAAGRYDQAQQVLRPRLSQSSQIRVAWLTLASERLPSVSAIEQWINEVQPLIETTEHEQLTLANAWQRCGIRFEHDEAMKRAIAILDEVLNVETPSPAALLLRGAVADYQKAYDEAERYYRAALKQNDQFAVAMNNLAVVLSRNTEALEEAADLAQKAIALAPNQLEYRDTLAQIYQTRGEWDAAIDTWTRVNQMDPENPRWLIAIANVRVEMSQPEEARRLLSQAEARLAANPNPRTQQQAEALRKRLEAAPTVQP